TGLAVLAGRGKRPVARPHPPPRQPRLAALARSLRRGASMRADSANGGGLVDAQHDALAEEELVVDPVVARVSGPQVLAENQRADVGIDQHAALDRRLVDAARAKAAEMLELQHIGAGIEAEQAIVERWRERQRVGTAIALLVEERDRRQHVSKGAVDRRPVAAVHLLTPRLRQEPRQLPISLAIVDKLLFAVGDRFRGVLRGLEVERLAVLDVSSDAANAQAKASAQHRHCDSAAHDGSRFAFLRRAAVFVLAEFDRREADAEGTFKVKEAPPGEPIA